MQEDIAVNSAVATEFGGEVEAFFDPLLESLLILAQKEHIPCTKTSLTAGLPLVDERLTPELFIRAAKRAGLSARVVMRPLENVSNLVLPAVLLLKGNNAAVLVKQDADTGLATLIDPESGGELTRSLESLAEDYSGYSIFTRPVHRFDTRVTEVQTQTEGHWFWGILAKSWRIYRDVLIASLLINIFALAQPLFVMNVYDRVVPNNAVETLWVLASGVVIVYLFDLVLKTLRGYFIEIAGKKSDILLSAFLLERVLGAKLANRAQSVGAFASQFREFESVRNFITSSTVTAFVDLPFSLLFILVIAYIGGPLVWVPLVAIPLIVGFSWIIQSSLRQSVEQSMQAAAEKNATFVEALSGIETIKILGAEGRIQRAWEASVGRLAQASQESRLWSNSAVTVAGAILQIASVAVVVAGVYLIADRELTVGALIACVLLNSRVLAPMAQVSSLMVNFEQARTSLESLNSVVEKPQDREESNPYVRRAAFEGGIQFDQVSFSYPNEEQASLDGISFKIRAGEKVAIIGRMGSGKTTLQKLIMGLYEPTSGAVLVDGVDLKQIDPADLRNNIGYVPQDVVLFYGSIKSNIAYGAAHASDADIIRAADIAGVSEFVNSHPLGFQRPVGERGELLSGGQCQSIAVARALINNPPIYLMDEPTTAMDNSTEETLKKNLQECTSDKTLLLITHKASLLSLVDRVLVLDRGKLVADGPKDSVLDALRKGQLRVAQS